MCIEQFLIGQLHCRGPKISFVPPKCCDSSMGSVVGEVVEIDGSIMEGGGQILRMSVCTPLLCPFNKCFSSFH